MPWILVARSAGVSGHGGKKPNENLRLLPVQAWIIAENIIVMSRIVFGTSLAHIALADQGKPLQLVVKWQRARRSIFRKRH
jgi:hypothetical protein